MRRFARFSRTIPSSGGQFDIDTAKVHWSENGYATLCGRQIFTRKNWQEVGTHWAVCCEKCLDKAKKAEEARLARW